MADMDQNHSEGEVARSTAVENKRTAASTTPGCESVWAYFYLYCQEMLKKNKKQIFALRGNEK